MPEGDTIFRTAQTLRDALVGQQVTRVASTVGQVRQLGVERLVGQQIRAVEPRGKHLLVWFAPSDLALHTHMRMAGSWHLYRTGERWRKPRHQARFEIEVPAGWVAVCFAAPTVELLSAHQVERHGVLAALGPDALAPDPDLQQARRRLDERAEWTIGEALLDQRVLAGVGNVYRNEVLFIHRVDPWRLVGDLDSDTRDAVLATAVDLLRANVGSRRARRVTTGGGTADDLYVHGRHKRPCTRCQRPIAMARQGDLGRLTYWCRACQGPGVS